MLAVGGPWLSFRACFVSLLGLSSNKWCVVGCEMEGTGKQGMEGSVPDFTAGKRGRIWAKVVGGQPRQPAWTSHKVSEAEVDDLWHFLNKVLEFSKDEMDQAREQWDHVTVLVQSLGWRVPIEWIMRDFWARGKIPNDMESFSLAEDHLFRFKTEERDTILHDGPWVIFCQLLAIKPWVSDFVPGSIIMKKLLCGSDSLGYQMNSGLLEGCWESWRKPAT